MSRLSVDGEVTSVDWSPCGNKISAACNNFADDSFSVQIFSKEGSTGNFVCQSTLNVDGVVQMVHWSPCGTKITAACNDYDTDNYYVKILNSETGALLCALRGHSAYV